MTRTIERACGMMDGLRAEHDELMPCAGRLAAAVALDDPALRTRIAGCASLAGGLDDHVAREDEAFPVVAHHTGDDHLVERFRREHREILQLRDAVVAASADAHTPEETLRRLATRLIGRLTGHMADENGSIFRHAACC